MSDLPPADWYTDPEDESQYRYWDGSEWTGHRSARHTDPDSDTGALRGPGQLISDSLSLVARRWRSCAAAAAVHAAGQVVMLVLLIVAWNRITMGELGEIWERATEPGFDPEADEHTAYFESLDLDFAASNFILIGVGVAVAWFSINVMTAATARIALSDMHGQSPEPSDALRHALRRVLRLAGLHLQLLAPAVVAMAVTVVLAVTVPPLLIAWIPALIAAIVVAPVVVSTACVAASAGPARPSLPYAARLLRGRFWASLGRILLIVVIYCAITTTVALLLGVVGYSAGPAYDLVSQLIQFVVSTALFAVGMAGAAILYDDLGGESD